MWAPGTSLVFTCHPLLRRLLLFHAQSLDRFRYLWPMFHGFAIPPKLQGAQEHFQTGQHLCPRSPILAPPPILWHEHRAIHHLRHINSHFPALRSSHEISQRPSPQKQFPSNNTPSNDAAMDVNPDQWGLGFQQKYTAVSGFKDPGRCGRRRRMMKALCRSPGW